MGECEKRCKKAPTRYHRQPHPPGQTDNQRLHRGVDLISDVLPFGRLWYGDTNAVANAIGYAGTFQPLT